MMYAHMMHIYERQCGWGEMTPYQTDIITYYHSDYFFLFAHFLPDIILLFSALFLD